MLSNWVQNKLNDMELAKINFHILILCLQWEEHCALVKYTIFIRQLLAKTRSPNKIHLYSIRLVDVGPLTKSKEHKCRFEVLLSLNWSTQT